VVKGPGMDLAGPALGCQPMPLKPKLLRQRRQSQTRDPCPADARPNPESLAPLPRCHVLLLHL
jgi:hypothetical protein